MKLVELLGLPFKWLLLGLLRAYQLLLRPILPPACRFEPT